MNLEKATKQQLITELKLANHRMDKLLDVIDKLTHHSAWQKRDRFGRFVNRRRARLFYLLDIFQSIGRGKR